MEKVNWKVKGMSCTNCALSVDKVLTGSGMQDVKVNFMSGEASFSAPENANKKNIQKDDKIPKIGNIKELFLPILIDRKIGINEKIDKY